MSKETMKMKPVKRPMICMIKITGESAEELFAAGPIDLRDYFLKKYLHVDPKDVKQLSFSRIVKVGNLGFDKEWQVHKDNIYSKKAKS